MSKKITILGCGYLGRALAECSMKIGWEVTSFTRNPETAECLSQIGVQKVVVGNLQDSDFKSKDELKESPNLDYWNKLMDIYNTKDIFAILKQRCGNCAAFNISDKMRDCIKKGIGDEAPTEPIIKVGEIGYCRFLKFKCAAARTCQAWVSGGPITSND